MLVLDPTFRRTETLAASFVFLVGLATILSAWGFQIIGGFVPCALCLEQRIPYYVALPLVLVSLVSAWIDRPAWLARGTLAMAGLVFLYGAYLGIHHAGVEWKWWAGPNDCAVGGAMPMTADNLLEQLESVRIVSCTEASWRFPAGWGLSFAGWNAVISLALGIVAIAAAARKRDAT